MAKHWTGNRDRHWSAEYHKWESAWVHYQADIDTLRWAEKSGGDIRDSYKKDGSAGSSKGILQGRFLKRRLQGEDEAAFYERAETTDYNPLFATMVDGMAGRLMSIEYSGDVTRAWSVDGQSAGLGDVSAQDSPASRLYWDIDGNGQNYLTMLQEAAIYGILFTEFWAIVEGRPRNEAGQVVGDGRVILIDPRSITRTYRNERGRVVAVVVRHLAETAGSIQDPDETEERYTLYTTEYHQTFTYKKGEGGAEVIEEAPVLYGGTEQEPFRWYESQDAARAKDAARAILPIWRTSLPLVRNPSYILAEKNGVILNVESERDNIERIMCTPLFKFVGSDEEFATASALRAQGWNAILQNPEYGAQHAFLGPDVAASTRRTDTLRHKIESFYPVAFRTYETSVQGAQATATEINQKDASGERTFLSTLATMLDGFEMEAMWRMEQVYFPNEPDAWGQFSVKRKKEFQPMDRDGELSRKLRVFMPTDPVVLTSDAELYLSREAYEHYGVPVDEDQLKSAIESRRSGDAQSDDIMSTLRRRLLSLPEAAPVVTGEN